MAADREGLGDRWLQGAVLVGLLLRLVPLVVYPALSCTRDECTYRALARGIAAGEGLRAPQDWLWAPAYPYLLAAFELTTGDVFAVKVPQLGMALASVWLMYAITRRVSDSLRAARVAAFLYALHPTLTYFTGTIWSELVYSFVLLSAVLSALWARDGRWMRALVPGMLVGIGVLLRGVATYMLPIFVAAMIVPASGWLTVGALRGGLSARWRHAVALGLAGVLTVAPYSISASLKHGGRVISDATLGQMMWLGNNDFEPVTFDLGNGYLNRRIYNKHTAPGRGHCSSSLPAAQWNACETERGLTWIKDHPREFVSRMPMRVSQLVNPHTFFSRHLRWGKWVGFPWWAKELTCLAIVFTSYLVLGLGTVAAWARARGPYGLLAVGIVGYHVAAIAALAGLSRYRLPLEPLWMVFLAWLLADPRGSWARLRSQPVRLVGAVVSTGWLLVLMQRYFWHGFPGWGGQ